MVTNGVGAVFFASERPRRLAEFYRSVLSLGEPTQQGDSIGMSVGGVHLGFEQVEPGAPQGGRATVWFSVQDVCGVYQRMLAEGAKGRSAPDDRCSPGEILATAVDLDGNLVGLIGRRSTMLEGKK